MSQYLVVSRGECSQRYVRGLCSSGVTKGAQYLIEVGKGRNKEQGHLKQTGEAKISEIQYGENR